MLRIVFILATSLLLSACNTARPVVSATADPSSRKVVESYLAALNRRDLLALTAYTTTDIEWYSVIDGERMLEIAGREALAASLTQFFGRYATTRWTIKSAQVLKDRVAVTEQSEWSEAGRTEVRTSLGVYELVDGRIRRITFYLEKI